LSLIEAKEIGIVSIPNLNPNHDQDSDNEEEELVISNRRVATGLGQETTCRMAA
jgi:hypothetical protein